MSLDLPLDAMSPPTDQASEAATIAELFARQVSRTPNGVALIAGDCQMTYLELDALSSRVATQLVHLGAAPEALIGVAMERTPSLIVSLLAILKSGAAYVPLDPGYPKDRLSWIMQDSAMPLLLTSISTRESLPPEAAHCQLLDVESLLEAEGGAAEGMPAAKDSNLAYVIYTSGSTGKPKGVMVENRNVMNFFNGMDKVIGVEPAMWLAVTSVSFDISVLELFWTLTRGFTIVLHAAEDPAAIADEIARWHVTHLQMTPSLARMLTFDERAFAALGSLEKIFLGGEPVPAALVRHLREVFRGEIYNMYGPTETTVWSTAGLIEDAGADISIGRPIVGTQVFILDSDFKPVANGDAGELFIGGEGVARGYWHRPDLTAERFLVLPSLSSERLYRTGDLARVRPDGAIDFLGRADDQIKLRGHRIEPGEIEAALEECPGIHRAVVILREDREGDQRLVAYLLADASRSESGSELRGILASKLPDYMVPASFVSLSSLPLTDNGKIDRKALKKLPPPGSGREQAKPESQPAATAMEKTIARLWQEALGIASVGLHDNFFDLGAHSLTVAEVHGRLQEELGREIDIVDLFQFSTVSMLAAHVAGVQARQSASDRAQRRRTAMQ